MKISKFSSLISKVSGCSGSSFSGSSSILAETAKSPAPWAFMTSTEVTNRVSASEAVTVSVFPSRLKRKLSRIGKEFLEAITLLIDCKRDNSAVLDTSNLIALIILSCYIIISHKLPFGWEETRHASSRQINPTKLRKYFICNQLYFQKFRVQKKLPSALSERSLLYSLLFAT